MVRMWGALLSSDAGRLRIVLLLPFLVLSLSSALALPALAQETDTTRADTVSAPVESAAADTALADTTADDPALAQAADTIETRQAGRSPVGFDPIWTGSTLTDSIPALLPALDLVGLLADAPLSFTYRFGTPGWPDGWSYAALPPQSVALTFNDLPFTHVFTGGPAYQLVPLALIQPPQLATTQFGHPTGVISGLRPFASPIPTTEAKYWKGGDGLQSIDALHAQHRRQSLFGNSGFLNLLGGYSGRAADGEYPGSGLRRGRQVLLRARYEQMDWSLEILNLHNRRRIGAHGGVIPDEDLESIYIRPGAAVRNPRAERRIVRNDLAAALRLRMLRHTTKLALFWTAETFRYTNAVDTLGTSSDRIGLLASQSITRSSHHDLSINIAASRDAVSPGDDFVHPNISEARFFASIRDTVRVGSWRGSIDMGLAAHDGGLHPVGNVVVSRRRGGFGLDAAAGLSNRPVAAVAQSGFGSLFGLLNAGPERVVLGRIAATIFLGPVDLTVGGFANQRSTPLDYFDVSTDYFAAVRDSAAVISTRVPLEVLGAHASLGWRRDAERGLYATVSGIFQHFPVPGPPPNQRIANTLPDLTGRARAGARFVLFDGDLDVDMYVDGAAWSSMLSRTLHPESGILTIPSADAEKFGPSGILNGVIEAGVRDATLFIAYENALSGTIFMRGNLMVPLYPLPERRFRFGVYWPIFG